MRRWPRLLSLMLLVVICGCQPHAVSQSMLVTSTPPGAACSMDRDGVRLGAVDATPGKIDFAAQQGTLTVTCAKPGYTTASVEKTPGYSPAGGVPLGLAGLAVQALAPPPPKSDWHYPAEIRVDLLAQGSVPRPLPLSGLRLQ